MNRAMFCHPHCSMLSRILFNIVTPDPCLKRLNNTVDNIEQCCQQNIAQCCFHQRRTGWSEVFPVKSVNVAKKLQNF